jgi:hypothetical protein
VPLIRRRSPNKFSRENRWPHYKSRVKEITFPIAMRRNGRFSIALNLIWRWETFMNVSRIGRRSRRRDLRLWRPSVGSLGREWILERAFDRCGSSYPRSASNWASAGQVRRPARNYFLPARRPWNLEHRRRPEADVSSVKKSADRNMLQQLFAGTPVLSGDLGATFGTGWGCGGGLMGVRCNPSPTVSPSYSAVPHLSRYEVG